MEQKKSILLVAGCVIGYTQIDTSHTKMPVDKTKTKSYTSQPQPVKKDTSHIVKKKTTSSKPKPPHPKVDSLK